ncbi:alpha/beta fold hydrolase [Pseudonocardia pini]|uniref:alpha/beta fold hydrolase n=1 Tax=Pseudonocardia pini TaxID=2758030 RepID=UPI0015EFDCD4|nr:alpha/beta fold hydrolase [Pseudonocardia pini]
MTALRVLRGGTTGPTLLLLHGLGATAEVWAGLTALLDDRAWVAPDLPGHGGSDPLPHYAFEAVAQAVAPLVDPAGTEVLGHSFGGVVGLHLAALPGVRTVTGLGIKAVWTPADLTRAAALADRPPKVVPTRADAVARHVREAGLTDPAAVPDAAVREVDGGWRTALDPRAFGVGDPRLAELVAVAPVPVRLARGEHDPMVTTADLTALVEAPVELSGLGHNAHVEDPTALLALLSRPVHEP